MSCYNFVVHERPCAFWSFDLDGDNLEYLGSIDPRYFSAAIEPDVTQLEDEAARMRAALGIRLTYGHALETLMALLGAAAQAPHCALPWMLSYTSEDLKQVVTSISSGTLRYSRIGSPVTWRRLSDVVHARLPSSEVDPERLRQNFADAWSQLAFEFLDESKAGEYNSLKHGLRVKPGGFSLQIRPAHDPDGSPIIDSKSEYGSSFFRKKTIDRLNYFASKVSVNWNPRALAAGVEIMAVSINNVLTFLKIHGGQTSGPLRLQWPAGPENAWSLPWEREHVIEQMEDSRNLTRADVELRSAKDILDTYD